MPRHRILIVDDHEPFRRLVCSMLEHRVEFHVIGQASDGLEAVQRAEELRPDLILLDIGLPKLNGIETARRIRKLVPESRILFLSQESDADIVQEALSVGTSGYVVKGSAGRELLIAVDAVLHGQQFVGSGLANRDPLRQAVKSNIHFHFEFDTENKILQGKFEGPVTSESLKNYYEAATWLVAGADFRGSITDFSGTTSIHVTPQAIRELAARPPVDPVASRPRVIVAPNLLVFGLARLFQMFGKATRPNLHVVRTPCQALALFGVATSHFRAIQ